MQQSRLRPASREAFCPSCERFIGPVDTCPYCDADSARSPAVALLRPASLIAAFAGLAILHAVAVGKEIPTVRIGDVTPMMNFAYVRVCGTVTWAPRIFRDGSAVNGLSFLVNDGSGKIRITADGSVARELIQNSQVPKRGNRVEVAGPLRCSAGRETGIRLQAASQLKLGAESGRMERRK
jgi:hypothetical protein